MPGLFNAGSAIKPGATVFTANGNYTVPAGVSEVFVTLIGGGGNASNLPGKVIYKKKVSVTPGQVIAVVVGVGGVYGGAAATESSFGALSTSTGVGVSTYTQAMSPVPPFGMPVSAAGSGVQGIVIVEL